GGVRAIAAVDSIVVGPNMPSPMRAALWCLGAIALSASSAKAADLAKPVRVLVKTEKGDIEVELDAAEAPATVANFLRYVDGHFYGGGRFHRTVTKDNQPDNKVKIEVIQGGIDSSKVKD